MAAASLKKFALKDLSLGMEIENKDQLSNIYDIWIFLIKDKKADKYHIGYIGKETNAESDKLFTQGLSICPVYNESTELEGDMYYEE